MVVWLRALTKKFALVTAAWKELEIWYILNRKVWGLTHCNDMIDLIMYILGSCYTWWVFLKSWRAGAQPEVCVCGSCIQQPREHSGQHRRSNNIAVASLYATITALNVGSLGAGTPYTSQKRNGPIGVDFHFTETHYLDADDVNLSVWVPFFLPQVAYETEQFALAKRACRSLWNHFTYLANGSQNNEDKLANTTGWGRNCIIIQDLF